MGTTNTVMAIKTDKVEVLQNRENESHIPSVVSHYKNQKLVGSKAIDFSGVVPTDTVFSIKRLMGRGYNDDEVIKIRNDKWVKYKIEPAENGSETDLSVVLGGEKFSPVHVSSLILKKVKEDAERRLSDKVDYAVITVPAYFTDRQKQATWEAGRLAGLKVQKILDEPTAAAISFGVDNVKEDDPKEVLVYDLGGGTFDVSILSIVGGIFAKTTNEGNMWLGGDDFDRKIINFTLEKIKEEYGFDATGEARFMVELKKKAEKAKKDLSSMEETEIVMIGELKDDDGNLIDVAVDISRSQFESMIKKEIDESIRIVKQAMENNSITPEDIDHVLLVGGSSAIPLVREELIKVFGEEKIMMNIDAMQAVAMGAGVLAARLGESIECPECGHINTPFIQEEGEERPRVKCEKCGASLDIIGDVTPTNYGIELADGKFAVIIPKSTPYPCEEPFKETYYVSEDNLRRILLKIFAGEKEVAKENEEQTTVYINVPPNTPKGTPVEVHFNLDNNGILKRGKVVFMDGSGLEQEFFIARESDDRTAVERKLDEQHKRAEKVRENANSEEREEIDKLYDGAANKLNKNETEKAKDEVEKLEQLLDKVEPEPQNQEKWIMEAKYKITVSNQVLNKYASRIDPVVSHEIKLKISGLNVAIKNNDETEGQKLYDELVETSNQIGLFYLLVEGEMIANFAENSNRGDLANKLRVKIGEIETKLDARQDFQKDVDDLLTLFGEVMQELTKEDPTGLKKSPVGGLIMGGRTSSMG